MTTRFKDYTNITFVDDKFNLCDLSTEFIHTQCPLQPGAYFINYNDILPSLLWTVRLKYCYISLVICFIIGPV